MVLAADFQISSCSGELQRESLFHRNNAWFKFKAVGRDAVARTIFRVGNIEQKITLHALAVLLVFVASTIAAWGQLL